MTANARHPSRVGMIRFWRATLTSTLKCAVGSVTFGTRLCAQTRQGHKIGHTTILTVEDFVWLPRLKTVGGNGALYDKASNKRL